MIELQTKKPSLAQNSPTQRKTNPLAQSEHLSSSPKRQAYRAIPTATTRPGIRCKNTPRKVYRAQPINTYCKVSLFQSLYKMFSPSCTKMCSYFQKSNPQNRKTPPFTEPATAIRLPFNGLLLAFLWLFTALITTFYTHISNLLVPQKQQQICKLLISIHLEFSKNKAILPPALPPLHSIRLYASDYRHLSTYFVIYFSTATKPIYNHSPHSRP